MSESNSTQEEVTPESPEVVEETVTEPVVEEKALTTTPEKVKKHQEAKKLVEEAKSIVEASDSELNDCKLLLQEDLQEYDDAKRSLNTGALNEAKALLSELGHTQSSNETVDDDVVVFEAKDDVQPMMIKNVSSGIFTGLILALLGGFATFMGLVYLATEKLGMTLDLSTVPEQETVQDIFGWFGTQVGFKDDALNGGVLVGLAVLIVMVLIYVVRVNLKGGSNLRFAEQQMKETQKYITYKTNCKIEMDRVDAHIKDAIAVLKDYEVVLAEQNGKLARIRHFEGKQPSLTGYHDKSVNEMNHTQNIIESISRFMATPMSQEGKLSGKSTLFLHSAKEVMQKAVSAFS